MMRLVTERSSRWVALAAVSLGVLMVVLDGSAVVVALPLIENQFRVPGDSLVWVVNAYLVSYAGLLLLSGRLGDLFGHRRIFLLGTILFAATSLYCALAGTWEQLISARLIQGMSGAAVETVALSLIMKTFGTSPDRARALGIYAFICGGGGAAGLLLAGAVTAAFSWRWLFFINVPIGAVVIALCIILVSKDSNVSEKGRVDVAGALTATAALLFLVFAVLNVNRVGWRSIQTSTSFLFAAALIVGFLIIETRALAPIVPPNVYKRRNLVVCCIASSMFSIALTAGVFLSLYLQLVLKYTRLLVSLVFLPSTVVMAGFSLGLSATLVIKFGIKRPLLVGIGTVAAGLLVLAHAPVSGGLATHLFPGLMLLDIGAGVAFNPLWVAAMDGVEANETGLVAGLIGTSSVVGAALGLAVLASASAAYTNHLLSSGIALPDALSAGYHMAFSIGALCAFAAALVVLRLPRFPGKMKFAAG